jgi:hypothetical protein
VFQYFLSFFFEKVLNCPLCHIDTFIIMPLNHLYFSYTFIVSKKVLIVQLSGMAFSFVALLHLVLLERSSTLYFYLFMLLIKWLIMSNFTFYIQVTSMLHTLEPLFKCYKIHICLFLSIKNLCIRFWDIMCL